MKGDIFNAVRHAQPILQAGKNGLTTDGRRWTQIEIKEIDAPVSALRLLVSGLCPLSSAGVLPSSIGVNSCNQCLFGLHVRLDTNYTDWARIESGALASGVWGLGSGVWGLGSGVWGLGTQPAGCCSTVSHPASSVLECSSANRRVRRLGTAVH